MIYLSNVSVNEKLTLEICDQLEELKLEYYRPNETIQFQGREININAFDQLRKRNPNNPYIMELKRTIMKLLIQNIEKCELFFLINKNRDEQFIKETLFELTTAWYLKKPLVSFNDVSPMNGELVIAMEIKSLQTDLTKIKPYLLIKEETEKIKEEVKKLTTKSGRHKLTTQE